MCGAVGRCRRGQRAAASGRLVAAPEHALRTRAARHERRARGRPCAHRFGSCSDPREWPLSSTERRQQNPTPAARPSVCPERGARRATAGSAPASGARGAHVRARPRPRPSSPYAAREPVDERRPGGASYSWVPTRLDDVGGEQAADLGGPLEVRPQLQRRRGTRPGRRRRRRSGRPRRRPRDRRDLDRLARPCARSGRRRRRG